MDNLTHTLNGLVAGEAVARCVRARPGGLPPYTRRSLLLAVGAVGSNLPDVDLAWSYAGGDKPIRLANALAGCEKPPAIADRGL
jgi:inner membrane protein